MVQQFSAHIILILKKKKNTRLMHSYMCIFVCVCTYVYMQFSENSFKMHFMQQLNTNQWF